MTDKQTYNEKELLLRIAEGDEKAFTSLYEEYYPLLFSFVVKITKSESEAQTVLQDVFLKIWMGREALTYVERFKPYLWVMVRHHSLNALRATIRRETVYEKYKDLQTETVDTVMTDPLTLIDEAVTQLPEHYRKVWIMNRHDKMKQAEIAESLGIALPTVKKYIQQAIIGITVYVKERSGLGVAITLVLSLFFQKK